MRSNSGDDEGRNLHRDPRAKEQERALGKSGEAVLDADARKGDEDPTQRTAGMGSSARKSGQAGER